MAYFHFFIFNRVADVVAGVNKNAREMSQKGGRKMSKKTGNNCPKKEDGKSKKSVTQPAMHCRQKFRNMNFKENIKV